jgi:futalosine hydrolase
LGSGKKADIGIIASAFFEGIFFGTAFKMRGRPLPGHPVFFGGEVKGKHVVFGVSGMGKTNAAHAGTLLVEKFSPSCIVNFGIGGAYPRAGLDPGDIAVAEKEVYADEGVLLEDGLHPLQITGIPLVTAGGKRFYNEFPVDRRLSGLAVKAAGTVAHCKSGVFLTVSSCTGTRKRAEELVGKFAPLCENMEGAALAHICRLYGIPFVEMRGISNMVGDRDKEKWEIKLAAENCQRALVHFLEAGGGKR